MYTEAPSQSSAYAQAEFDFFIPDAQVHERLTHPSADPTNPLSPDFDPNAATPDEEHMADLAVQAGLLSERARSAVGGARNGAALLREGLFARDSVR